MTVSAVPDKESAEVGGVQNTMTNLGASLGTALAGSLMIAAVSAAFLTNIQQNPDIPDRVKEDATVKLGGGVQFISDADFKAALDEAGVRNKTAEAALDGLPGRPDRRPQDRRSGSSPCSRSSGSSTPAASRESSRRAGGQTVDDEDDP